MVRSLLAVFASVALASSMMAPAAAAPCRDAKGKFIKCTEKPASPVRCKDAKGKFAKCGTPGARPA